MYICTYFISDTCPEVWKTHYAETEYEGFQVTFYTNQSCYLQHNIEQNVEEFKSSLKISNKLSILIVTIGPVKIIDLVAV